MARSLMLVLLLSVCAVVSAGDDVSALYKQSNQHYRDGKLKEALAGFEKVAADSAATFTQKVVSLKSVYSINTKLKNTDGAIEALRRLAEDIKEYDSAFTRNDQEYHRYLLGSALVRAGQQEQGVKVLYGVIESKDVPDDAYSKGWVRSYLASYERGAKNYQKSYSHCIALMDNHAFHSEIRHLPSHLHSLISLTDGLRDIDVNYDELVKKINETIAAIAVNWSTSIETFQHLKITVLYEAEAFNDALYESKIMLDVGKNQQQLESTVQYMSRIFKAMDGSLYRVNYYVEYKQFGPNGKDGKPNTADDVPDPLEGVMLSNPQSRDEIFARGMKKIKRDWKSRLVRAHLYRYWGKPKEALKELKIAFGLCPIDQKSLQSVTDAIVDVLVQITGDPDIGNTFVAFQKYGPAGPDEEEGTKDDLENPLVVYSR